MKKIEHLERLTANQYLNLYKATGKNKVNKNFTYYVASRAKDVKDLKMKTRKNSPDGVIIFSLYGDKKDQVVLVRQYRTSIDDYIYEFPAGLVELDEDYKAAGIREMKEETGLTFIPLPVDAMYEKPYFTTIGMTDESCATIYGYSQGEPNVKGLEENEELEVIIADRREVRRILKEENVAIMCAYMLMHFLHSKDGFDFLK
ncbi:MAG TPA: NUDIX hydrolase [Candidatus Merdenecus merdavium]|nr:NUDIX hydrolase [Candidatus Merdenecus merdavium]